MSPSDAPKVGRPSEPGEYDEGMQALLQIIWGDGFLSPGGVAELACLLEGSDIGGLDLAQRELEAMEGSLNPVIVHRIGPERARHFIDNWRQLVIVLKRGELRPGHFKAAKPA